MWICGPPTQSDHVTEHGVEENGVTFSNLKANSNFKLLIFTLLTHCETNTILPLVEKMVVA